MRWTWRRHKTNDAFTDGEVVWSWHPDADAKLADDGQQMTVTIKPVAGESTKEAVKTIRVRECRGDPGATVVANSSAFYILHARLRVQRGPGIPARPLLIRGGRIIHNSGAVRAARTIGVDSSPHGVGSIKSQINLTSFLLWISANVKG